MSGRDARPRPQVEQELQHAGESSQRAKELALQVQNEQLWGLFVMRRDLYPAVDVMQSCKGNLFRDNVLF